MAKHPHLLELVNNKTWRCTLDGCSFFVHIGLAYVLPGKSARCWKCNDIFVLTEDALKDHKPICDDCRLISHGEPSSKFSIDDYMAQQTARRKQSLAEGHDKDCEAYLGGECHCTIVPPEDEIEIYEPDDDVDSR